MAKILYYQDYIEKIKKQGAVYISNGAYASVYTHPTEKNKVIKIGHRKSDGYITYVRYVMKQRKYKKQTIHFPKIYSFKQFGKGTKYNNGTFYYVAVLERLEPLTDEENCDFNRCCWDYNGDVTPTGLPFVKAWGVLKKLKRAKTFKDCSEDFCGSNVMRRTSDGTIVITDPYC
jgi:hypothetical protein